MKIIFFGTPEFALPALQRLIDSHHEVVLVVIGVALLVWAH